MRQFVTEIIYAEKRKGTSNMLTEAMKNTVEGSIGDVV